MSRIDRFAPRQRVRRRRAVRRRADLDHRARQLRADRPGLVLQHRRARRAGELRRPRRRVPRRAVVPAVRLRVVPRSRRRWSSSAGTTSGAGRSTPPARRSTGAGAAVRLHQRVPQPRRSARSTSPARRSAPAATLGEWLAGVLSEYLNRTGSVIVILTLILLAIIMSTQFSFGRLFARARSRRRADGASRGLDVVPRAGARSGGASSSAAR